MLKVLYIYRAMIPSVLLCGHYQLNWLCQNKKIEFQAVKSTRITAKNCSWANMILFVRADSYLEMKLAKKLSRSGKILGYILDDDLLDVPKELESACHYRNPKVQEYILETMKQCQLLISPSNRILTKYKPLNFSQVLKIEEPCTSKKIAGSASSVLKIGFAGSIDRTNDVEVILTEAISRILRTFSDSIRIEFFGARPKIVDTFNLSHIPYCDDYYAYTQIMDSLAWDIGLAPMPKTSFHACKYYNKYIEYSGRGIAGIYSNAEPYCEIIFHKKNGLLCENTVEGWYSAIVELIENSGLRKKIASNGKKDALTQFTVEETAKSFYKGIQRYENKRDISTVHGVFIVKWCSVYFFVLEKIKKYGWKSPIVIYRKMKTKIFKNKGVNK